MILNVSYRQLFSRNLKIQQFNRPAPLTKVWLFLCSNTGPPRATFH